MAITDRVTVLRDGRVAARLATRETTAREIVRAMTGSVPAARPRARGECRRARCVCKRRRSPCAASGKPLVDGRKLQPCAPARSSASPASPATARPSWSRRWSDCAASPPDVVRVAGRDVTGADVAAQREAGLAYIPEDRAAVGTAAGGECGRQSGDGVSSQPAAAPRLAARRRPRCAARARALIARFDIRIASERTAVGTLSGGNMQKIVLARELSHAAPVLIAEQPTRGLDVGATEFIHGELLAERDARPRGAAGLGGAVARSWR